MENNKTMNTNTIIWSIALIALLIVGGIWGWIWFGPVDSQSEEDRVDNIDWTNSVSISLPSPNILEEQLQACQEKIGEYQQIK